MPGCSLSRKPLSGLNLTPPPVCVCMWLHVIRPRAWWTFGARLLHLVILQIRKLRPGNVKDFPEATHPVKGRSLTPVSLIVFPRYQVPPFLSEKMAAQRGEVVPVRPQSQSIILFLCP